MNQYIAFLRAINVGGRRIKMDELRGMFESGGFHNVSTLLASGNVIFDSVEPDADRVAGSVDNMLRGALEFEVDTFIRTPDHIRSILEHAPFDGREIEKAATYNVGFLGNPLSAEQLAILQTFESDVDQFRAFGTEIHWLCSVKQSQSEFTNARFERAAHLRATFRGIKTIERVYERLQ
jgi:uncharacterized protein (DUF1697 family)